MKLALLLISATLSTLTPSKTLASDLKSLSPGTNETQIMHDGISRRLIVTIPQAFDRETAYPILFCFHGAGGKADGQSSRWSPQADKRGLIVISAEAVQPFSKWNFKQDFHETNYDDVGFVSKVVKILIAQKLAEPESIYATGHSSGGLFSYRLAKETDFFAAVAPMSCGMAKDAHEPDEETNRISVLQVIGDKDKSFLGSSNPKVTMYSAEERIDIWRTFNRCDPEPVVVKEGEGEEITVYTYTNSDGLEVVYCKVADQEHHLRRDLRDSADVIAMDFLLRHKKK